MTRGGRRPGAGVKRRLDGGQIMSVYLDTDTLTRIDKWCKQRNISRSEAIRRMVCLAHRTENKGDND